VIEEEVEFPVVILTIQLTVMAPIGSGSFTKILEARIEVVPSCIELNSASTVEFEGQFGAISYTNQK